MCGFLLVSFKGLATRTGAHKLSKTDIRCVSERCERARPARINNCCTKMHISLLLAARLAFTAAAATDAKGRGVLLQLVVRGSGTNNTRSRWQALAEAFDGSTEVYVARVFCDGDDPNDDDDTCGALLGGQRAVYPIVLHGSVYEPEQYWGSRTLEALKALGESIRAPCSAWRPDRCDEAAKAKLEGFQSIPHHGLDELTRTEAVAKRARMEALEDALEEQRETLLVEWDDLGTVRRAKVKRGAESLRAMGEVLASRGVGVSQPRGAAVLFEEETYSASELSDDYAYAGDEAYADDEAYYDDGDELGPYCDYDGEDPYGDPADGDGYEDVEDVDQSQYADYDDDGGGYEGESPVRATRPTRSR